MKTARGPGTLLIRLCGGKTWSSDRSDKGGHEAGGGGQTWASGPQPCFMRCLQDHEGPGFAVPSLPWGPQCYAGLLDTDCKSTGGKGPPMPRPHTEPIVSEHKGPTQATALHSWATGLHGEACARGIQPPAWASLEWGPRSFPPQGRQSVWPSFKPQIQAQTLVLYTNPRNQPPLLQRKEESPLSWST